MKNVFFHTTSIHKVCVGGRDLPIICYKVFSFLIVRTYTNYVLEEERNSLTVSLKNVFFYELIRIMSWKGRTSDKNVI